MGGGYVRNFNVFMLPRVGAAVQLLMEPLFPCGQGAGYHKVGSRIWMRNRRGIEKIFIRMGCQP